MSSRRIAPRRLHARCSPSRRESRCRTRYVGEGGAWRMTHDGRMAPAEARLIDGLLLLDKPAGITSHDALSAVRRALGTRRIGHAGTLDPFATGLLVLLVGRATRLLPYVAGEPKVYQALIRFGA